MLSFVRSSDRASSSAGTRKRSFPATCFEQELGEDPNGGQLWLMLPLRRVVGLVWSRLEMSSLFAKCVSGSRGPVRLLSNRSERAIILPNSIPNSISFERTHSNRPNDCLNEFLSSYNCVPSMRIHRESKIHQKPEDRESENSNRYFEVPPRPHTSVESSQMWP